VGGRVFRGSPSSYSQMPGKKRGVPYNTDMPELFVTISNEDVEEPVEAAYAKPPVTERLTPGDQGGGDWSRPAKPSASSGSKKQMAPAVAQLFSSVSAARRSIRDEVAELLDVHPQGIELNNFCRVFETCFHHPFDSRWSDVSSLRQMLESMVDIVECVEHGSEVIVRRKLGTGYFQGNASQL